MMMMSENMTLDETYGHYAVYSESLRAVVVDTLTGATLKRYKGESAWSDAERYASDLALNEQYA
jgi:hypothetical protein